VKTPRSTITLIELLVVMVILVLLASLVAPRVIAYLGNSSTEMAKVQIESLNISLELFKLRLRIEIMMISRAKPHQAKSRLPSGSLRRRGGN